MTDYEYPSPEHGAREPTLMSTPQDPRTASLTDPADVTRDEAFLAGEVA